MLFGWSPRIGDPTYIGWMTVAAYVATAAVCWRAGRGALSQTGRPGIWHLLAVCLLALGVNKQLDLQTLVVSIGRQVAFAQGWYDDRAKVQVVFIAVLLVAAIGFCVGSAVLAKRETRHGRYARRALVGLVVLATFVVIRAASFHHVDHLLGLTLTGLRVNQILELGGIALIAVPSLAACIAAHRTQGQLGPAA